MKKINVLFISGIPNNKLVEVVSISATNDTKYIMSGSTNIFFNIQNSKINKKYQRLDLSASQKINMNNIDMIFNQISDPDSHSRALSKVNKIYQKNPNIKMLNNPSSIIQTTRSRIYNKLKNIPNLIMPKTIKFVPISPEDINKAIIKYQFTFPLILRKTGTHGGESVKLMKKSEEIDKLYDIALDGNPFYLIQFHEYKVNDIYVKYRLIVVDGEVFIRHVISSDKWMIHSRSRNVKYEEKEIEIIESFENKIKPKIQETITEISKKVKVDYFGIDCFIDKDFNILIFELNANMNVLVNTSTNPIFKKQIEKIKNAIEMMIIDKSGVRNEL